MPSHDSQGPLCVCLPPLSSQTLTNSFKQFDTNRNGWIQLTYEQFLTLVFSLKA